MKHYTIWRSTKGWQTFILPLTHAASSDTLCVVRNKGLFVVIVFCFQDYEGSGHRNQERQLQISAHSEQHDRGPLRELHMHRLQQARDG